MNNATTKDSPEQIKADIETLKARAKKYPEYRAMLGGWIAKYEKELAEATAS